MIGRLLHRAKPPQETHGGHVSYGSWPWSDAHTIDPLLAFTEDDVRDLPVVSGFLGIVTSLVQQMPLRAYAGTDVVEPTPIILRNPAPGGNRVLGDFLKEYLQDIVLHGNYLAVVGDPGWDGWPQELYPVPYGGWRLDEHDRYVIGTDVYDPGEVFHICVRCRTGQYVGHGFLDTHRHLIGAAVAAERWASSYFTGGATPTAILSHPNAELTQDQADTLKAKLRMAAQSHGAVIVPAGTTLQVLNSDAEKAQLNETRRMNALALCQALGIPAALLGLDSPSLTYRNIRDVFSQFLATTVMGLLVPLEQQLNSMCLPRTMTARFDPSVILRPDVAERVKLAVDGLAGNVFTRDEARSLLDLPPVEDRDEADEAPQLALVEEATP